MGEDTKKPNSMSGSDQTFGLSQGDCRAGARLVLVFPRGLRLHCSSGSLLLEPGVVVIPVGFHTWEDMVYTPRLAREVGLSR